jgi:hypothetical protein
MQIRGPLGKRALLDGPVLLLSRRSILNRVGFNHESRYFGWLLLAVVVVWHTAIFMLLIEKGADILDRTKICRRKLLSTAASKGHEEITDILLKL